MPKSKIETELLEATGVKRKTAEKFQAYAARLVEATQELEQDAWDELSKAAQSWTNAASKAVNAESEIDAFPDDDEGVEEETERTSTRKPAAKKAGRGRRAAVEEDDAEEEKKPAKNKAARGNSSKEEKGSGEKRKVGAQTLIKQLLCDNPALTTDELQAKLEKKGFHATPLAISSIRSGFRHTVKVMNEKGLTNIEL